MVRAVVVDVVGHRFSVLTLTADAAADGCFAGIVGSQLLRIRQHGLQELDRHDFHAVVDNRLDACHADVLNHAQVCEVFLSESHPETCAFQCRVVLHQAFQLFVIHQIGFARTDVRIRKRLVNRQRVGFLPFAVFIVFSALCNLTDIDFRIEVGGESLAVVTRIAVYNVEMLHFREIMFCGISGIHARNARVETAAENCRQAGLFEAVLIRPLPAILIFGFIKRLIIGRVEIVYTTFQTSVHNCQILIRKRHVDDDIRLVFLEQLNQLRHAVGINTVGHDIVLADGFCNIVAFDLCARSEYNLVEHIGILGTFVRHYGTYTASPNN